MMNYELLGIFVTVLIQAIVLIYKIGQMSEKLISLEKKQDKHNNLVERMIHVEDSTKSAHHRIDFLETNLKGK